MEGQPQIQANQKGNHVLAGVLTLVTALLCFLHFWFGTTFVLSSPDTGWLIRTGQWIIEHGRLPAHDIFSWTYSQQPWMHYQWLFEVIVGWWYLAGGLWLAGLGTCVVIGLTYFYMLPKMWSQLKVPVPVTLAFMFFALSLPWFTVRPQVFSCPLVVLFIWILERYRQGKNVRLIWCLPLLSIAWVNLHSIWLMYMGLPLTLAYCLLLPRRKAEGRIPKSRIRLAVVFAISCAAALVNPYGASIFSLNEGFVRNTDFNIYELQTPLDPDVGLVFLPFFIYLVLLWVVLLSRRHQIPILAIFIAAGCTLGGLLFRRYTPVCVLATWPFLGLALSTIDWGRVGLAGISQGLERRTLRARAQPLLEFGAPVLISVFAWITTFPSEVYALSVFSQNELYLYKFLREHKEGGNRIFNDALGSYLIFFDVAPVFIDTRYGAVYPKKFCLEALSCVKAAPGWQRYLSTFGITHIVIKNDTNLFFELFRTPDWLLVYADRNTSYWLSNTAAHRALASAWGMTPEKIRQVDLPPEVKDRTIFGFYLKHLETGRELLRAGQAKTSVPEFQQALVLFPNAREAHQCLIHAYARLGERDLLVRQLRLARPNFWRFPGEPPAGQGKPFKLSELTGEARLQVDKWAEGTAEGYLRNPGQFH